MLTLTQRIAACVAVLVLGGSVSGQVIGHGGLHLENPMPWGQPDCDIFYVSADTNLGNDNNLGTINQPFLTINHAIWMAMQVKPAVVVVLPGIYSGSTNGEWFPIMMEDEVSLQGFGATNTVLKSDEWSDVIVFQDNGVDGLEFDETYVDSLTLTNGYAGVAMVSEFNEVGPTISNCVIVDNHRGISMDTIWDHATGGYIRFFPRLINDTIVHNTIGIFDMGHLGPEDGKGVAEPAIVNCTVMFNLVYDLAGPDNSDVSHSAFQTVDYSMLASGNQLPMSWGWVSLMTPSNTFIDWASFDYRQRPGSLLVDVGTLDLSVGNGNEAEPLSPCGMDIFDFDEEGYGNPRIERTIDVGADEQGQVIIAGYIPLTTTFGTDVNGTVYQTATTYHLPDPNPGSPLATRAFFGGTAIQDERTAPLTTPGARANGTIPELVLSIGSVWIDRTTLTTIMNTAGTVFGSGTQATIPIGFFYQWNGQEMTQGTSGAVSPLSNLQSFRTSP
ncbi:MAG: DUF1565 domain-containing protein [Phycisphaerales bacterium]|jgi:hypothetical protein|nr:DUF1565 domain-containing protein [Phycisphaerales bacterium]MDP6889701.1 DUF1565 domain-containing protein [Phycisphaerales bacterium]